MIEDTKEKEPYMGAALMEAAELLRDVLDYLRRTRSGTGIYASRKTDENGAAQLEGCEKDRFLMAERVEKFLAQSAE
jgi:hypothetical protein